MVIRMTKGNAPDGGFMLEEDWPGQRKHITKRELEALSLVGMGLENQAIAQKLSVSVNTVRNHLQHITEKLRAKNRTHLVVLAVENGTLEIIPRHSATGSPDEFLYCIQCERCFRRKEMVETETEGVISSAVGQTEKESLCAYKGCPSDAQTIIEWSLVRKQHPEYPEAPQHGTRYEYDWLEAVPEDCDPLEKR